MSDVRFQDAGQGQTLVYATRMDFAKLSARLGTACIFEISHNADLHWVYELARGAATAAFCSNPLLRK